MTKEEIQASIKSIMFSGSVCGIEIYACLRDESGYQTKKIRATDKLLSSTKDKVAGFINCTYLADDAEFDTSENIADNKKEFYEISLIENYRPFIFLDDAEKRTEYYSESDRNKLSGFLFRINLNDKYFWVYQHIYSVSRIDRSKNVIALFVGDTYDEIDSDIVQIDSRADSLLDELEMRWEDEQKLNGLSSVHSMGFRQFIFYLAHKVDFIAEIFLCTMILFGNVGAQPAASFLLKFASFAKFLKQPESLCCFCTNQIFNFFSCNTAVFQCILKNE